jgi:drug/metabolite transporter (DMT)-like permease
MIFTWSGLALLDPTFQAFLFRFTPVINIFIGSIFFGEILRIREIFPIIFVIFGGVLSCVGEWKIVHVGIILTILAVLATSIQMFIGKDRIKAVSPKSLVFYRAVIGAIVIAIWAFSTGRLVVDVDSSYWIVILIGAFLGPTLSFLCMFHSFRHWEFYKSSVVLTVQPLIVLPLAYVFLNMLPDSYQLYGGLIMIVGVLWLFMLHLRSRFHINRVHE